MLRCCQGSGVAHSVLGPLPSSCAGSTQGTLGFCGAETAAVLAVRGLQLKI